MAAELSHVVALAGMTCVRVLKYNLRIALILESVDLEELQSLCLDLSNLYWKFASLRHGIQRVLRQNAYKPDAHMAVPARWLRDLELLVGVCRNTLEDIRIIMRWSEKDTDPIVDPPKDGTLPPCPAAEEIEPIHRRLEDACMIMGFIITASLPASNEDMERLLLIICTQVRKLVVEQLRSSHGPVSLSDRGRARVPKGLFPVVLPPAPEHARLEPVQLCIQPAELIKGLEPTESDQREVGVTQRLLDHQDKAVQTSEPVQGIQSVTARQPVHQPAPKIHPATGVVPVQSPQPVQSSDPGPSNGFRLDAFNCTLLSPDLDIETFSAIDFPHASSGYSPLSADCNILLPSSHGLLPSATDDALPSSVYDVLPAWSPDVRPPSPIDKLLHLPDTDMRTSLGNLQQWPDTTLASSENPMLQDRLPQFPSPSVASPSTTPITQSVSMTPFDVSTVRTSPVNLDIISTIVEATRPSPDMQWAIDMVKSRTWNVRGLRQRRGIRGRWLRVYPTRFMDGLSCCGIKIVEQSWIITCPVIDSSFNSIPHPGGIWADARFVVKDNTVSTYHPEYGADQLDGFWDEWIWEEYTFKNAADAQSFGFCLIHLTAFVQQVRRIFIASTSHLHPAFPLHDSAAMNLAAYLISGRGGDSNRVREWLKALKITV